MIKYVLGTFMTGTKVTLLVRNIMTRNEFHRYLAFWPKCYECRPRIINAIFSKT